MPEFIAEKLGWMFLAMSIFLWIGMMTTFIFDPDSGALIARMGVTSIFTTLLGIGLVMFAHQVHDRGY